MGVSGARWEEPATVDYLRPGDWLCFGCRVAECNERAAGCRWRQYHEGKRLIPRWWAATGKDVERPSLRVVGINLADDGTEAVLEMLNSA